MKEVTVDANVYFTELQLIAAINTAKNTSVEIENSQILRELNLCERCKTVEDEIQFLNTSVILLSGYTYLSTEAQNEAGYNILTQPQVAQLITRINDISQ